MVSRRLQGTKTALQAVAANCFGANTYVFLCFGVLFIQTTHSFFVGKDQVFGRHRKYGGFARVAFKTSS